MGTTSLMVTYLFLFLLGYLFIGIGEVDFWSKFWENCRWKGGGLDAGRTEPVLGDTGYKNFVV